MTVQTSPGLTRLPLSPGQKVLVGCSVGLIVASALMVWYSIPLLPARIPTHWSGASTPDSYGPPSTLWGLWAMMVGIGAVFGLLAWQVPRGRVPLNGMPPITEQNAPHIYREIRTMFLIFQFIPVLMLFTTIGATVLYALGGPNLIGLTIVLIVLFPLSIGYSLYRVYYSPRPPH